MVSATVSRVVCFLGLSGVAEIVGDTASFPPGVLYPYSGDVRRVCTSYEAVREECPEAASVLMGEFHGDTVRFRRGGHVEALAHRGGTQDGAGVPEHDAAIALFETSAARVTSSRASSGPWAGKRSETVRMP